MIEDCISRKAVLNTLEFCDKALDVDRTVESYKSLLEECYKMLPSVQHKAKVGHWIPIPYELEYESDAQCSVCGEKIVGAKYYKCCPMCMAKMEVKE